MIEVDNLTKRYSGFTAIEDVSFSVDEGEVIGFLGPNGAGKTTTMRILTCFMPATTGTAKVAGYDVNRDPLSVRRNIGYLPENVPLYTDMPVEGYIDFMAKIKGVPRSVRREYVNNAIDACGLDRFRSRLIGKLSKGYRQRVGLAQSLVHDPKVLILDEPTIGLDPRQIIEIRNLIKNLGGEHTVILSTHILPEASMVCSRIIVINDGRIAGTVKLHDGKVAVIDNEINGKITNLEESGNIYLKVRGPSDRLIPRLKLIPQITDVIVNQEEDDGVNTYIVIHEMGADIRSELTSTIVYSNWGLLEMRPVEMTLEDAFLELIRESVPDKFDDDLDEDELETEQEISDEEPSNTESSEDHDGQEIIEDDETSEEKEDS